MAIGARISPQVIIFGTIDDYIDRVWDGERTGSKATIHVEGGPLELAFRKEDDDKRPAPGSIVALVASAYDGQRGSSLTFVRHLMPSDLDAITREAFKKQAA